MVKWYCYLAAADDVVKQLTPDTGEDGSSPREILIILSIGLGIALALAVLVMIIRKPRDDRQPRDTFQPEPASDESDGRRKRRRRRRRRAHRPRNPSLHQTGGLPPPRPEGEPPIY